MSFNPVVVWGDVSGVTTEGSKKHRARPDLLARSEPRLGGLDGDTGATLPVGVKYENR